MAGSAYVCSLPNVRGDGSERHVLTRDLDRIAAFAKKWDVPGRATFFCVSTIQGKRTKENALQTMLVHADVDFKDVLASPRAALEALEGLDLIPSRIHASGHGLHAYWLLEAPAAAGDRVEAILRKICAAVGGDRMVAQAVALMRVPGTHNSKDGGWTEVEVLRDGPERYALEQLERWRPSLVIRRKLNEDANPFLEVAQLQGFKPPLDVEQRLADMRHHGEGDRAVHATQLSVSASMMSQGVEEDEVVETILAATKLVAGDVDWNWQKEEAAIRGMCTDWARKHPETAQVVSLKAVRQEKVEPVSKAKAHVILGTGMVEAVRRVGEDVLYTRGQLWRCRQGLWKALTPAEERSWVEREVEKGCRLLRITSTSKIISETRQWVQRNPDLYEEDVEWDSHKQIATRSGLVHPITGKLTPIDPSHRVTRWIDCDFDGGAACPRWLTMLEAVWPDPEDRGLFQEVLGTALVDDRPRSLRRAVVLYGPSGTGKSNLLRVAAGLLSAESNTTSFDTLENPHGLVAFLKPNPWVLHEAFDQAKWHFSASVKGLLSADPVHANIKNGPIVEHRFRQGIFWGTNSPPQFREASRAMESRLVIIGCHEVFDPDAPVGVAVEARARGYSSPDELILGEEKAGLLNWAIQGLQRAWKRGFFLVPEASREAVHQMRLDSNLAAGFVEDCVEFDPDSMVATPDFCGALVAWWQENRGAQGHPPSNDLIGRAVASLGEQRIGIGRDTFSNTRRHYIGVRLNEAGLDFWQGYSSSRAAMDSSARISPRLQDVNKPIPVNWSTRPSVVRVKLSHR